MQINSTPLPRGKKFYGWPEKLAHVDHLFESLLKKESIEVLTKATKLTTDAEVNGDYWRVRTGMNSWKVLTDEKYPIIEMNKYSLAKLYSDFKPVKGSMKAQYGATNRISNLDIPLDLKTLKVQYDPERKGLIIHDHIYEGELVSNKPMVVNKNLKSLIREKVGEIELLTLLGDEDYIGVKKSLSLYSNSERGEAIAKGVPKLMDGSYEDEDLAIICFAMDRYIAQSNSRQYDCRTRSYKEGVMPKEFSCYLDPTKKGKGDSDFKFPANVRTKLIYHFGGYTLPDNYEEWFDG